MARAIRSISGEDPISFIKKAWWLDFERAVAPHAGHGVPMGVEAQEEERHAVPLFELLQVQLSLEAEIAVAPLRLVQIELPQVGPLMGVVPLEPHTRRAVDEACAIAIPPTDHVPH